MSDRDNLKTELKTAATVAMTLGATTFGAPEASATEMDSDFTAKTEMITSVPEYSAGDADIMYDHYDHPSNYRTADEYARAYGLRRDHRLSEGVQRPSRDFSGYAGAYIDYSVHPNDPGRVVYLPNDMQCDSHRIMRVTESYAHNMKRERKEAYWQPQHDRGYDGHYQVGKTLRRVDEAVHGVGQVVDGLHHIFGGGRGR